MYSIHEKLQELCPIIQELIADEGIQRRVQGGGGRGSAAGLFGGGTDSRDLGQVNNAQLEQQSQVMNEMLARLVNLQ